MYSYFFNSYNESGHGHGSKVAWRYIYISCKLSQLILDWHIKGSTDPLIMFGFFGLYCVMRKLYYVLPPSYVHRYSRSIYNYYSPWYNTISKKSAGNYDDQSLSPVTSLVRVLFLSLIP